MNVTISYKLNMINQSKVSNFFSRHILVFRLYFKASSKVELGFCGLSWVSKIQFKSVSIYGKKGKPKSTPIFDWPTDLERVNIMLVTDWFNIGEYHFMVRVIAVMFVRSSIDVICLTFHIKEKLTNVGFYNLKLRESYWRLISFVGSSIIFG